jgi:serine/threonine protein kinase
MVKRKTRKQRAGAFVAQGSYGCGFANPPLPCVGEATRRNNKFLSKLMSSEDSKDEIKQANPFLKADPTQRYFLPPRNSCNLNTSKIVPENNFQKCKFKKAKSLLFYEYGGDNLTSLQLPVDGVIPFFESLTNLFEGLITAHKSNIYLMDIKPDNLVSIRQPDGTYQTRFIDFGLAIHPKINIQKESVYASIYKYWSFDVLVAHRAPNLDKAIQQIPHWINTQNNFSLSCIPHNQFELFERKPYTEIQAIYQPLLTSTSLLLSKADVFSLGLVLSFLMNSFTGHNPSELDSLTSDYQNSPKMVSNKLPADLTWEPKAKEFHTVLAKEVTSPFFALVSQMLEVDPQKRSTPEQALALYNSILPKIRKYFTAANIDAYCRPLVPKRFL